MASATTRKVAGATAGVAVGAAGSAAAGYAMAKTAGAILARVGPRAAAVAVPGLGVVAAAATVVGGVSAGVTAARAGESAAGIAKATVLGAVGIPTAHAAEKKRKETPEQARERLGKPFGGSPNDVKLAAENERRSMQTDPKNREAHERRALALEAQHRALSGQEDSKTPAKIPEGSLWNDVKGMFKHEAPPELTRQRDELLKSRDIINKQMAKGKIILPETRSALDQNTRELTEVNKKIDDSNPFKQGFQIAAPIGAILGGTMAGYAISGSAKIASTGAKAVREISKIAGRADKLTSRGVILNGTVAGDKAKAAVSAGHAAISDLGRMHPSSYALPAFNVAAGGAELAYGYSHDRSDPTVQAVRVAGAFEFGLGIGQYKGMVTAANAVSKLPGVKTAVSKLDAAANRLVRESRKGPAGAAIARANGAVTQARGTAERAVINAAGRTAAAKTSASVHSVRAGTRLEMAKVKGAAAVERAEINAKGSNSRAISRQNVDIKYKDVWQDKRGRTLHRKDMSVRTRKGKAVANDNHDVGRRKGA